MTLRPPTLCQACVHQHPIGDVDEIPTCDAYPDGIPWDYWGGGASHHDPDGSDSGIFFESREGPGATAIVETFISFWDIPLPEPEDGGPTPGFDETADR